MFHTSVLSLNKFVQEHKLKVCENPYVHPKYVKYR